MADSSEMQSKADAELQRSKRDQQDSSFLETLVPIPDFFFNIKAEIGTHRRVEMAHSYIWTHLVFTSEWQKPGFTCKPLQKTTLHGLSTDWSFDECVKNVNVPHATNVKSVKRRLGLIGGSKWRIRNQYARKINF